MKEVDPLSLLTIVIPTLNRGGFVRRQCRLWDGEAAQVLIVDGSEKKSNVFDEFSTSKNIKFEQVPGASYGERMFVALRQIRTPYVATLADDDIFLKSGLRKLIDLLERKSELTSAIGRTARFHLSSGEFRGARRYNFDSNYPSLSGSATVTDYFLENINRQYLYYALYRSDTWAQNIRAVFPCEYSSPYVSEVCIQLLGVLRSSSEVLDELYWLRSDEAEQVSNSNWDRSRSFNEWYLDPRFDQEKERLFSEIGSLVQSGPGFSAGSADLDLRSLLNSYVTINRKVISKTKFSFDFMSALISGKAPGKIKPLLKRLTPNHLLKISGVGVPLESLLTEFDQIGVAYDFDEVRTIVSLMIE